MRCWIARWLDRLAEALYQRLAARLVAPLKDELVVVHRVAAQDVESVRAELEALRLELGLLGGRILAVEKGSERREQDAVQRHVVLREDVRGASEAVVHLERRAFGTTPPVFRVPERGPRQYTMADRQ